MVKFVMVLVVFGLGVWAGAYQMRASLSDAFASGEGRAICQQLQEGQ